MDGQGRSPLQLSHGGRAPGRNEKAQGGKPRLQSGFCSENKFPSQNGTYFPKLI
jgi:hypothetical protein